MTKGLRPILNELDISKHNKVDKLNTDMVQPYMAKIEQNLVQNGTGFLVGKSVKFDGPQTFRFASPTFDHKFVCRL